MNFHLYEDAINKATQLNETKEYRVSQRKRKLIEELFGEAKEYMGLRVSKFRRMKFVREQVLMTAAVQNIKRMVKLLSSRQPKQDVMAGVVAMQLSFITILQISAQLLENINKILFGLETCWIET